MLDGDASRGMDLRLLAVVALAFAVLAPTGQAIYIVTPLTLVASAPEAEVGDTLDLDVAPNAEHENGTAERWGGRTVHVRYAWDPHEGEEHTTEEPREETRTAGDLALDAEGRGTLAWTVPAEVDDRNVHLRVESEDGEFLARFDLVVGDAEPMYYLAAETGPAGGGPVVDEPRTPLESGEDAPPGSGDADRATPGAGLAVVAAAAVAAALVARRRG